MVVASKILGFPLQPGYMANPGDQETGEQASETSETALQEKKSWYPLKRKIEQRKLEKSKRVTEGVDGWRGGKGEGDPEPKQVLYGGFTLEKRNYRCGRLLSPIGIPPIPRTPHTGRAQGSIRNDHRS